MSFLFVSFVFVIKLPKNLFLIFIFFIINFVEIFYFLFFYTKICLHFLLIICFFYNIFCLDQKFCVLKNTISFILKNKKYVCRKFWF